MSPGWGSAPPSGAPTGGHEAHDILGDSLGHLLEVVAGDAEFLQAVESQTLELGRAGRHLVMGQIGLEPPEDVLGQRALLGGAGHAPGLREAHDGILRGYLARRRGLLEGGQVQVQAQPSVARLAGGHGPGQIVGRGAGRIAGRRRVRFVSLKHGCYLS